MKLYIIRHGAAAPKEDYDRDADRPLTAEGRTRIENVANLLARLGARPSTILTSPFVRAVETAQILSNALAGAPVAESERLTNDYAAADVLDLVAETDSGEIALVGHAPQLDEVLARMTVGEEIEAAHLGKAGCACVEFEQGFGRAEGVLQWLVSREIAAICGAD